MKKAAAICLIVLGTLWLVFCELQLLVAYKMVIVRELDALPKQQQTFSREEARALVVKTTSRFQKELPLLYPGWLALVAGGVLLLSKKPARKDT